MTYYNINYAHPSDVLKLFRFNTAQSNVTVTSTPQIIWFDTHSLVAIIRVAAQRHDACKVVVDVYPGKYDFFNAASFTLDLFRNIDIISEYEVGRCIKILSFITGLKLEEIDFIIPEGANNEA